MDRTVGETFYLIFTTRAFATGIPGTLGGTPVVSAYENEGLTQITAGITLGIDHDGVTGLNLITMVATGANGYDAGKDYNLVITAGTVDSVSVVGEVVGSFSLGLSSAFTRLGAPAGASIAADIVTADAAIDVAVADLANGTDGLGALLAACATATGFATPTNITAGTIATVTDLTNLPNIPAGWLTAAGISSAAFTAAKFAAGAIDAAALSTDAVEEINHGLLDSLLVGHTIADSVGLVLNEWQDGGRLDLILDLIVADTGELQTDWVNGGRLDLLLDAVNTTTPLSAAQVNTEVDNAIVTYGLDHLLSAAVVGADVADNSIFARLVSSSATADWDNFVNTDDSLQAISESGGGGPTAVQIRQEMDSNSTQLTAIVADTGELQVDDVPGLIAALDAVVDTVKAETVLIVADTGELQVDWVNGGRLDLLLDAVLLDTGTTLDTKLNTIDDFLDTEIASILTTIANIETDTQDLQTQIGTAGAGLGDLGGMSTAMKAEVNTEVDLALDTTIPELSVAVPAATPTIRTGLMFLYMGMRNKRTTDATSDEITNDAGTKICAAVLSDDTVDYIKGEYA